MDREITIIKKSVKHISLKVKPSCEVVLTVPMRIDESYIAHILKQKASWIEKKIAFFQSNKIEPKKYINGDNFLYLGKSYELKIIEESTEERVKIGGGYLLLFIKEREAYERKKLLLDKWYRARAYPYFEKTIARYLPIIKREVNSLKVRPMRTRWGSCNHTKGYINLNLELIKRPKIAIEYVIFHELAHLIHPNHSKEFYNYLDTHMPNWRERKLRLES